MTSLAELVEAVNALPSNTARLDCAQHLRAFYGWPDVNAHDLPVALAAVASFDTPQGATAAETGQTGDSPSRSVPVSEALGERPAGGAPPKDRLWPWASGERPAGWWCSYCGFHPSNRGSWCEGGCGRDYNKMTPMTAAEVADAIAKRAPNERESRPNLIRDWGLNRESRTESAKPGATFAKPGSESRTSRDDSPEARADRLEAGAATQRLTDLGGILVDQHGREYWQPLDQGPRVPAGVELWFFDPGAEAKMGAKDRQAWNQAWLLSARMMQLRSEWENKRAGRAVPLLVAADDSTPF